MGKHRRHAENTAQTATLKQRTAGQPGQQDSMFRLRNDKKTLANTVSRKTIPNIAFSASTTCMLLRARAFAKRNHKVPSASAPETAECGLPRRLSSAVTTDAKCEIVNQSPRTLNLKKTSTTSTNVLRKHNQTNKLTSANTNGQPVETECVTGRCHNRNATRFAKC